MDIDVMSSLTGELFVGISFSSHLSLLLFVDFVSPTPLSLSLHSSGCETSRSWIVFDLWCWDLLQQQGICATTMALILARQSLFDNVPAAYPPMGEQSKLVNPPSLASTIIHVNGIALICMVIVVICRFWVRAVIRRDLSWDDCKWSAAASSKPS